MNPERELTIDELDAVSGGAQQECTDVFACALLAILDAARSPSGGGLVAFSLLPETGSCAAFTSSPPGNP